MRKPNHLVLDFEQSKNLNSNRYWAVDFMFTDNINFLNDVHVFKKYQTYKQFRYSHPFFKKSKKFTLKFDSTHFIETNSLVNREGLKNLHKPISGVTDDRALRHFLKYSQETGRDAFMYLTQTPYHYSQRNIKCLLLKYEKNSISNNNSTLNTVNNIINVNFLRKERLYTKLKYSRSPAFDIVSGGAAALLAAFVGFLISEKFGYELVDSGDFYYLFMYLVFIAFSVRPLLTVSYTSDGFFAPFNLKRVLNFYVLLLSMVLNQLKSIFK